MSASIPILFCFTLSSSSSTSSLSSSSPLQELWGRDFQISRHSFDAIVSDDEALLGFLTSLEKFGVVLVTKAPREPKAAFNIVNKAGFPKRTHYG